MNDAEEQFDDPLLDLSIHQSSVALITSLLRSLAYLAEPGVDRLPADLKSYLAQSLDIAADVDLLFAELANAFDEAGRR